MVSVLISIVSLLLSLTVAWLTLFRRGKLAMTRPVLLGFLYEGEQPKIFFRAMLYATGKRGHILETLYLKVRRDVTTQTFNFWMYGETKDLKVGSGLRAGEDGGSFNHHFLPPKDETSFRFLPGEYAVSIYARTVNSKKPLLLCSLCLYLSESHAETLQKKNHWAVCSPKSQTREPIVAHLTGAKSQQPLFFHRLIC